MTRDREPDYPPLMLAQLAALRRYAQQHGRGWKTRLSNEWLCASAEPLLHGLRNSHGPCWLVSFALDADPGLPAGGA